MSAQTLIADTDRAHHRRGRLDLKSEQLDFLLRGYPKVRAFSASARRCT